MQLNGKVRSVLDKDYFLDTVGAHKSKTLRWINYRTFNEKGMLTTSQQYNDKNDTISRCDYFYDTLGKLQKTIVYAGGSLMYQMMYRYDNSGNKIAASRYTDKDSLACSDSFFYNTKNLCIACSRHCDMQPVGSILDRDVDSFYYNDQQQKIRLNHISRDGFVQVTKYTYDKQGNCIEEIVDTTRAYEEKKTIHKYDEKGRLTEEASWDANGTLTSKKTIEYLQPDKQGNATTIKTNWHDLGPSLTERTITYY